MVLVTGASGLVGSHLIEALVNDKQSVIAIYRSAIPAIKYADAITWIQADILDVVALEAAFQNIHQVYHCAAIVSFQADEKYILQQTNIEGTANVVNACLENKVSKLVYVSSVAALGKVTNGIAVNEKMNWIETANNSEYGKTKYLAEMEIWRGIGEGLNAIIVNPSIILGAGNWNNGSTAIFKTIYNQFPWYTNGSSGFVDVEDVVKAMLQLMQSNITSERFIISGYNIPYFDLFTTIAQQFNKRKPYKKVTPLLAQIVWRLEAVKAFFTRKKPLLTKETARTAQMKVLFDNSKLLQYLPNFTYTPLTTSIARICKELIKINHL